MTRTAGDDSDSLEAGRCAVFRVRRREANRPAQLARGRVPSPDRCSAPPPARMVPSSGPPSESAQASVRVGPRLQPPLASPLGRCAGARLVSRRAGARARGAEAPRPRAAARPLQAVRARSASRAPDLGPSPPRASKRCGLSGSGTAPRSLSSSSFLPPPGPRRRPRAEPPRPRAPSCVAALHQRGR
jgi:hypothetical protein